MISSPLWAAFIFWQYITSDIFYLVLDVQECTKDTILGIAFEFNFFNIPLIDDKGNKSIKIKDPETPFIELLLTKNVNENHLNQICKEHITPWGLYFDGLSVAFVQPLIVLLKKVINCVNALSNLWNVKKECTLVYMLQG